MSRGVGIGTKVDWIHTSKRGKVVSFEKRFGVVVEIDGTDVIVRRGKRKVRLPIEAVHASGTGSDSLKTLVSALAEEYRKREKREKRA